MNLKAKQDLKAQMIDLFLQEFEEEQAFIDSLTDEESLAAGTQEHWSAKDVVAHVAGWKEIMSQKGAAAVRGETPPDIEDIDAKNAELYASQAQKPWSQLQEESKAATAGLVEGTQALSEEDLTNPRRFDWQAGRPLYRAIQSDGFSHPISHFAQYYAEHGKGELATHMQEEVARQLATLDPAADWQGIVHYNLACTYALNNQRDKALSGLRMALNLNPGLKEWSSQDPDFAALRSDPEYLALTTD